MSDVSYRQASWDPSRGVELPLNWRAPRCISTSDMFHALTDEAIDRVFAVMALCPQHQFIVLTKRTERVRGYLARCSAPGSDGFVAEDIRVCVTTLSQTPSRRELYPSLKRIPLGKLCQQIIWPLPNVTFHE